MFKQRNLETSLEDTSAKLTAKPDYEMRFSRVSILNLNASIAWHISWARRHTISIARVSNRIISGRTELYYRANCALKEAT